MIIEKVEMKNGFIMCIDWVENGKFFHLEVTPKDIIENYKTAQQSTQADEANADAEKYRRMVERHSIPGVDSNIPPGK